ncbi:cell division protein FtsQ/DivIB [Nocardiopsis sp. FIRDI 009]|uniref:cell division protein FtsQ/DivIB n=1 Tax=Nocardiopsis sp. FIRDI 009 TaxID=714197 RepID=UPI003513E2AD
MSADQGGTRTGTKPSPKPGTRVRRKSDPWKLAFMALLVVALVCVVTWVLLGSRLLVVRDVAVTGLDRVSAEEVVAAVDVPTGTPLIRVDLEGGAERAESIELVESATLTRGWPATLRVEVVERQPLLAVRAGDEYRLVDGDGVRIEDSATRPGTHPVVRVTGEVEGNEAVRAAADIVERAPDSLLAQIQLIDATETDEITLDLGDGSLVEWGDPSDTADKSAVLRVLMSEHPPQEGRVYDVSVPDLAIVR